MKILMLTRDVPKPLSGAHLRPYYFIKYLVDNYNYQIDLFSLKREEIKETYLNDLKEICNYFYFHELSIPNSEVSKKITSFLNTFKTKNLFSKNGDFEPFGLHLDSKFQKIVDKKIEENDYDLIYSDSVPASYVSNSDLSKVVDPRDEKVKNWLERSKKAEGYLDKFFWYLFYKKTKYVEKNIFNKFNYCLTVTKEDKKRFNRLGLNNVEIIQNGVDVSYYQPKNGDEDYPSIIYTGVMNGRKNIKTILCFYNKIFPKVKQEFPNIKFYVVGKNPAKKVKELEKDSNIIVTGYVEDVRGYLDKSNVFICPMREGSGIKNKVLEAMSMAKPVVSTSVGMYGIDADDGEEALIADGEDEFASNIIKLLKEEELRKKMGENARELIEDQYTWKEITKKLDVLLKQVKNSY